MKTSGTRYLVIAALVSTLAYATTTAVWAADKPNIIVILAAKHPQKLKELHDLFLREAKANKVFSLDDRGPNRTVDSGRPSLIGDRTTFTLGAGAIRMPEDMIRTTFNRSHTITASVRMPTEGEVGGVLLPAGGHFGGLSLYVKEGRPHFTYNYFGSEYTTVAGQEKLPSRPRHRPL